ncbi:hypothetical protein [Nostoc sp.]|uniref:hypothetical protein n=1 Tax=Nostoc sp. TaxID=1180 RepID=UPI002FF5D906
MLKTFDEFCVVCCATRSHNGMNEDFHPFSSLEYQPPKADIPVAYTRVPKVDVRLEKLRLQHLLVEKRSHLV